MMEIPNDLIRQATAADLLKVKRSYIGKLIRLRKLPSYTAANLVSLKDVKVIQAKRETRKAK